MDFSGKGPFLVLARDRAGKKGPVSEDSPPVRLENCLGLRRPSGAARIRVHFQLVRDSGTFELEGQANETSGAGTFSFTPQENFVEQMPEVTAEQIYKVAVYDVSVEFIRDVMAMGYSPRPSPDQLIAMRASGIDGEYIGDLKRLGYEAVPVKDLIRMRKSGVTAEFLYALQREGVGRLSVEELIRRASRAEKKK